jgi:hypothetical protein
MPLGCVVWNIRQSKETYVVGLMVRVSGLARGVLQRPAVGLRLGEWLLVHLSAK